MLLVYGIFLANLLVSYLDIARRNSALRIKRIHQFLTKLDIFSTTLGGQNFVTGSIVFPVVASLKKLLKIDSEDAVYIAHMKEVVLDDFKQRIADNLNGDVLLKCTALDPRFKSMKIALVYILQVSASRRVRNKIRLRRKIKD